MAPLKGNSTAANGVGVLGESKMGDGVVGSTETSAKNGIFGRNEGTEAAPAGKPVGNGVFGFSMVPNASGVFGAHNNGGNGVAGRSSNGNGVFGYSGNIGVRGQSEGYIGVYGAGNLGVVAEGRITGIHASASRSDGFAGVFQGNVRIFGNLLKPGGGFIIDHPLDPANRYLLHSFVESPNRTNIYDGTATLDANGEAVITLADWFEELNDNFRYQLTAIGRPAPNLHVSAKVNGNKFQISGGEPGMEVCWQVSGIRKDPWALNNPLTVEEKKNEIERGKYLHPTLYDQPESMAVGPALDKLGTANKS